MGRLVCKPRFQADGTVDNAMSKVLIECPDDSVQVIDIEYEAVERRLSDYNELKVPSQQE
jgi:hypothetical protein